MKDRDCKGRTAQGRLSKCNQRNTVTALGILVKNNLSEGVLLLLFSLHL